MVKEVENSILEWWINKQSVHWGLRIYIYVYTYMYVGVFVCFDFPIEYYFH